MGTRIAVRMAVGLRRAPYWLVANTAQEGLRESGQAVDTFLRDSLSGVRREYAERFRPPPWWMLLHLHLFHEHGSSLIQPANRRSKPGEGIQ